MALIPCAHKMFGSDQLKINVEYLNIRITPRHKTKLSIMHVVQHYKSEIYASS